MGKRDRQVANSRWDRPACRPRGSAGGRIPRRRRAAGEGRDAAIPLTATHWPAVGNHIQRPWLRCVGDGADDLRGIIHMNQVEPTVGIDRQWPAGLQVGDARQAVGPIQAGEPQGHAGPEPVAAQERLGLEQHGPGFARRMVRGRSSSTTRRIFIPETPVELERIGRGLPGNASSTLPQPRDMHIAMAAPLVRSKPTAQSMVATSGRSWIVSGFVYIGHDRQEPSCR